MEGAILVDVFCDTIYLCTDMILQKDAEKVKQDIEQAWGYDKNKISFYEYTKEDYQTYLDCVGKKYMCKISPGEKVFTDYSGQEIVKLVSVKKY